ncbi:ABC transporter substrate-binding protein [Janthinobacterium lividum]|jgi:trehalose/maltose transport system substrate-binding protein|uniref:ABC transporter substrate-binding protein n=1 Tax=Janthinobacterium lividum TaxID=29581 RepID=UPI000A583B5F|nr:ABC transporter substrate-binding protein [Janthinobacterium lividum]
MIALKKILKRHMFGAAVAALLFVGGVETAKAAEITITSGSAGQDFEIFKKLINDWSAKTGNTVKLFNTPNSTTDTLALLRQQFGAKSSEIDVLMVDVIWPGVIKQHLMDLKPYTKGSEKNHFPAIVANNTIDGKLLAMPWYIDAGLLYYRKDLLDKYKEPVPATWEEMRATAQKIQDGERKVGNKEMQGYVFQGKTYEGLTCNALEWVSSYKGGSVIEGNGKISIDNPQAVKALDMAASWIGTISPRNVLSFTEEEARGVFQNGNSIFMRNWPYAWSLAQKDDSKVKGKVGVAALPKGGVDGQSAASLGGWSLAISKYSKHPAEAADLLLYLTSKEGQKRRAIQGSYNPTIPELYGDADVLKAVPFASSLYEVFTHTVARPSTVTGEKYNEASGAFWNAAYATLSGKNKGADSVKKLSGDLAHIRRGDKW